jgi:hypothetical protein
MPIRSIAHFTSALPRNIFTSFFKRLNTGGVMSKAVSVAIFAFLVFVCSSSARAQWDDLGSKEVTDRAESDVFHLATEGQFRALRIRVARAPVRFYRMEVTYGNGEKDTIELRSLIRAGGSSRVIDLKGRDRFLRSVKFWYEAASLGRGRRATVTLYGRK